MAKIMIVLGLALAVYGLFADEWKMSVGGIGWMMSGMVWEGQ